MNGPRDGIGEIDMDLHRGILEVQQNLMSLALLAKMAGQHGFSDYLLATSTMLGHMGDVLLARR